MGNLNDGGYCELGGDALCTYLDKCGRRVGADLNWLEVRCLWLRGEGGCNGLQVVELAGRGWDREWLGDGLKECVVVLGASRKVEWFEGGGAWGRKRRLKCTSGMGGEGVDVDLNIVD